MRMLKLNSPEQVYIYKIENVQLLRSLSLQSYRQA